MLSSLPGSVTKPADPTTEYVEVRAADGSTAYWYFVEDTALRLAGDAYTADGQAAPRTGTTSP